MRRALATIAAATALAASLMVTGVGAAGATELAPSAQSAATADRNGVVAPLRMRSSRHDPGERSKRSRSSSTMRGIGKQVYDCVRRTAPTPAA